METKLIKGALEVHIKDEVFFIKGGKAYYADGREMPKDKAFVCPHCTTSPPFVTSKEIDFAKHIVEKHPDKAKGEEKPKKKKGE